MLRVSTKLLRLLTLLVLLTAPAVAGQAIWPLDRDIDLSSGFGDYRPEHFHFGVDIRTGGTIGKPVVSPVSGYVFRVKTAYTGYGKALYIKGDDGYLYVMGHLSEYAQEIDGPLKAAQLASKRYFQDIQFPPDSIPVKQGQLIAYTGQTGTGAPHLHFEKRRGDYPLNPLVRGFDLDDRTPPVFERLAFKLTDDRSLMTDGSRKLFLDVTGAGRHGRYTLDTVLYMDRPFGLLVECFDQMRPGGMRNAVYRLTLKIDGRERYNILFDSLDFNTNKFVKLEYDYGEAVEKRKYVRRLFRAAGNEFQGSRAAGPDGGVFGISDADRPGLHHVEIFAEDAFGNTSTLAFDFLWGGPRHVYELDSTVEVARDTTDFYLSPAPWYDKLGIDSAVVYLNRDTLWGATPDAFVTELGDGRLRARVRGMQIHRAVMRLHLFTKSGAVIRDNIFNGLPDKGNGKPSIEWDIGEDGLLVTVKVAAVNGSQSTVALYDGNKLLGTEHPTFVNMWRHVCLVPPEKKYEHIDRIAVSMARDTGWGGVAVDGLDIRAVGFQANETIPVGRFFSVKLGRDNFYKPHFIALSRTIPANRSVLLLNSFLYEIKPEVFVTSEDFTLTCKLPEGVPGNEKSGLCWRDTVENKWVWLDNTFDHDSLTAYSLGGGLFAAVLDFEPPSIRRLSIYPNERIRRRMPPIKFMLTDTLSGIPSDTNILIELDGEWLIPEYEPETDMVNTRPNRPLEPGKHHLGIEVTDRVGNKTERYLNFFVTLSKAERERLQEGGKR